MLSVLVALGGGAGAAARFVADSAIRHRSRAGVPVATLLINVVGSFLLGIVAQWATHHDSSTLAAVVGVGFLGGFTTFSTAAVELVVLVRERRPGAALLLALGMLVLSLLGALLGMATVALVT